MIVLLFKKTLVIAVLLKLCKADFLNDIVVYPKYGNNCAQERVVISTLI